MRGEETLFKAHLGVEPALRTKRRGRSTDCLWARDRKLVARYYYYTYLKRWKYEDTIRQLEKEFDLIERTVIMRLTALNDDIKTLFERQPKLQEFKMLYPFLVW
jgi:hypothetical protein